ncbi:hypothetical protein DCS_03884 [Drechmeria coniospora]|uniref:F-box domain-containing protein n=1 Tax=Drechmeria coniospora TaxID=98403 RepID=A0A151GIG9_DRECN|nr:hypothetical protein DCS_03884 [Drechmeria coniospora]KYK56878.1 hypothetical protein DCS_03884 [Drechmeria coniospora]ODA78299.1 hypothetical protein RJ55_05680 [Drechmeria coniospora]
MESLSSTARASRAQAKLPTELILHIIDCVLPANPKALLPPSHLSTRTLVSLTRVSRATYSQATRLLRQRCVYVDSSRRLADVLLCMSRLVPTLPAVLSLRHLTSLYLAPFVSSLDDPPTAVWVRELFCEVGDTLRRLVVQMPFSSLDPLDDHLSVRRTLREGFEQLTKLEEFVCLGEYPALSVPEAHTDVWRLWPSLQRLVLFGVPMNSHWLWWDIATLPELAHVVLARPQQLESTNIKDEYFHKLPRKDPRLGRKIKVVLLGAAYEFPEVNTRRWKEIDPSEMMTVEVYEVPTSYYGDETPQELVTNWIKRGALSGTLWGWSGNKIGHDG